MPFAPRLPRTWLFLIVALCGAVYAPTACNGFTFDDAIYAKVDTAHGPNPLVRELQPLSEYFSKPYGYPMTRQGRGFRPATVLSFTLTHRAFGSDGADGTRIDPAWPHHVVNILLHMLATWLAFELLVALGATPFASLAGAAIFGLHAIRSDVVASIVGRGELFGFVFGAASLLACIRACRNDGARRAVWATGASALLMLALLGKESAVSWVAFLPLVACIVVKERPAWRTFWTATLTVGPPLVLFIILRERMLAEHGASFQVIERQNPIYAAPWDTRFRTAGVVLAYGLFKSIVPFSLSCEYGTHVFELVQSWGDPRFLGAAAILIAGLAAGLWLVRRQPKLFVAAAAFFGFAFPVSNLVIPIETIFGERLYYTPALALSIAVAWLFGRALEGRGRTIALSLLGVWLAGNAALCVKRSFDWRDNATLFAGDAETQPRSVFLNMHAAALAGSRGDFARQERHLQRILAVEPDLPLALVETGHLRRRQSQLPQAIEFYERALASPKLQAAETPAIEYTLANTLQAAGQNEAAKGIYRRAVTRDPASRAAHDARTALLWLATDDDEIEKLVAAALAVLPVDRSRPEVAMQAAVPRLFSGRLAFARGDQKRALREWERSLPLLQTKIAPTRLIDDVVEFVRLLRGAERTEEARDWARRWIKAPGISTAKREALEALLKQ